MMPAAQQERGPGLARWWTVACTLLAMGLSLATVACAPSKNATGQASPVLPAVTMGSEDDPADPVALALHELAGRLLMHQALHRTLPLTLDDLKDGRPVAVDPASGRPFLYTPRSGRHGQLPGRVIVCQPVGDATRGRWALLLDDRDGQERVITYVQRIVEQQVPRATSSPARPTH